MTMSDIEHWTEPVAEFLDRCEESGPNARWPVLRRGPRAGIARVLRELVLRRDNHRCRRCSEPQRLRLDHVVPWSHLGPDRSYNLQTLCDSCNSKRSNRVEMWAPRLIGVTVACDPCLDDQSGDVCWPVYCGTCDSTSWTSTLERIL